MRHSSASALRTPLVFVLLLQLLVAVSVVASDNSNAGSNATEHEDANKTATHVLDKVGEVKIGPGLVAAVAIGVGLVVCFAGYRLFRPTVFACGFVVGGVFLAGVAEAAFKNQSYMATASWVAFFIGGLAVGSLVLYLYSAGIFLGGAAAGVMLAFTLNTSLGPKLYPENPDVVLVVMAVLFGVCAGLLALKLERPVLIVATSFVGAEMFIAGVGYFAGSYPNGTDFDEFRTADEDDGHWVYDIPSVWWVYVGGAIALFVLGMVVQFKKTAHGQDHAKHRAQKGALQQSQPVSAV
jgi:hypothetical protein